MQHYSAAHACKTNGRSPESHIGRERAVSLVTGKGVHRDQRETGRRSPDTVGRHVATRKLGPVPVVGLMIQ